MRQILLSKLGLTSIATAASQESLSGSDQEAWKQLDSTLNGINALFKPPQNYQAVSATLTSDIKTGITRIPPTAWTAPLAKALVIELAHSAMRFAYPEEILIQTLKQMPSEIMIEIRFDLIETLIDQGQVSAVQTLIDRGDLSGLDWNAYNTDQARRQLTPLTHAITTNTTDSLEIVKILIKHGVDLNRTWNQAESCVGGYANGVNPALEYCVIKGNLETLQLLIKKGATQGLAHLVRRVIAAPGTYPYSSGRRAYHQNQMAVLNYLKDIHRIRDLVNEPRDPATSNEQTLHHALTALKQTLEKPECTRDQLIQPLNEYNLVIKASAHVQGTFFIQPQYDESNGILQTFATLPLAYMIPDMNRSLKWLFFSPCKMSERRLNGPSNAVDAVMRHPDLLRKMIAAGATASTLSLRATTPMFRDMMPGLFATPIIQTSERSLSCLNRAVDEVMRDPDLLRKIIAVGTRASTFSLRATALTFREMIPAPRPTGLFVAPSSTAPQGDSQQAPDTDEQAHPPQNGPS